MAPSKIKGPKKPYSPIILINHRPFLAHHPHFFDETALEAFNNGNPRHFGRKKQYQPIFDAITRIVCTYIDAPSAILEDLIDGATDVFDIYKGNHFKGIKPSRYLYICLRDLINAYLPPHVPAKQDLSTYRSKDIYPFGNMVERATISVLSVMAYDDPAYIPWVKSFIKYAEGLPISEKNMLEFYWDNVAPKKVKITRKTA